jgi:hypothetical protein
MPATTELFRRQSSADPYRFTISGRHNIHRSIKGGLARWYKPLSQLVFRLWTSMRFHTFPLIRKLRDNVRLSLRLTSSFATAAVFAICLVTPLVIWRDAMAYQQLWWYGNWVGGWGTGTRRRRNGSRCLSKGSQDSLLDMSQPRLIVYSI